MCLCVCGRVCSCACAVSIVWVLCGGFQNFVEVCARLELLMCRLIIELKLPPGDAYQKLRHTIDEFNTLLSTHAAGLDAADIYVSPAKGNVIFCSALFGISFTIESFATMYAASHGESADPRADRAEGLEVKPFAQRLWGDAYYNKERRTFHKTAGPACVRSFVHFILEPLYKIFSQVWRCEREREREYIYICVCVLVMLVYYVGCD